MVRGIPTSGVSSRGPSHASRSRRPPRPPGGAVSGHPARPRAGQRAGTRRRRGRGDNLRRHLVRAGSRVAPAATFPVILGNGVGGTVDRTGPDVDPAWIGTSVVTTTGGTGGYAS